MITSGAKNSGPTAFKILSGFCAVCDAKSTTAGGNVTEKNKL